MKKIAMGLALIGFGSFSVACAMEVDDGAIGNTEQELGVATKVKRVFQEWEGENPTEVSCGSEGGGTPYALSVNGGVTNTASSAAMQKMNFVMNDGEPRGAQVKMDKNAAYAMAICANYIPNKTARVYDSDGDQITYCPSGHVAVGGEAICTSSNAKLIVNRPYPANAGDEPTAWRGECSTGGVTVSANCVLKGGARDWDDCKVRKQIYTSGTWGNAVAYCEEGELAVGSGTYCGDGGYIQEQAILPWLESALSRCSEDRVTAYAVCCPGVYED